jgi:spore photoproduct lyase
MRVIYVEVGVKDHPRTQSILAKYPTADVIECEHYKAVFNPKGQNFRQQKEQGPALILAEKKGKKVMSAPAGFGIGHQHNYYFSHLLNCPYDCRYCFLQGMYPSANWVLFVNFEDFMQEIKEVADSHPEGSCVFFSGYDGDSLAMDGLSGFLPAFLDFFRELPQATLELRSKSTQIRSLLTAEPIDNVVVAYSLTPAAVASHVEHKAPSVEKRLVAIEKLVAAGWNIGLRFDPLIQVAGFEEQYQELMNRLQALIPVKQLHSVSIGALRFPNKMLDKLQALYPKDKLLMYPFEQKKGVSSYPEELEQSLKACVHDMVSAWVGSDKIFSCEAA